MKISIVDPDGRLVGSSWHGSFGEIMEIPAGEKQGIVTRSDAVMVFATARPVQGFDALGLRCMIEQSMPSEAEIRQAVGGARRASA